MPSTLTLTLTLATRLYELISACFTGFWVQTHERHEAAREITDLCRRGGWRFGTRSCYSGAQFPVEQITMPGITDSQDPLAVIRAMPQLGSGWIRMPALPPADHLEL